MTRAHGRHRSEVQAAESGRKTIIVDALYDIETTRWTHFLCGGLLDFKGHYQAFKYRREELLVDALLAVEGRPTKKGKPGTPLIWAHNGGRFDHKWLLDHLLKRKLRAQVIAAGANIISIRVAKQNGCPNGAIFLDSKALSKLSLADFTAGLQVTKQKTGFKCSRKGPCKKRPCGGYCRFKKRMTAREWARLMTYLEADCRSMLGALDRLQEYADKNDLDLCPTVGSSAWSCAKRWLELPDAYLEPADHKFVRRSYFGGRVFVGKPFSPGTEAYPLSDESDVNSMYPSRLAQCAVPVGEPRRRWGREAERDFADGRPGIYRCEVDVPKMHIPPLPVRTKYRVAYPWGQFVGTWARPELDLAMKLGVKVRGVREAVTWPAAQVIFAPWVERLFQLRADAPGGKKGALGTFLKFFLNSLTGKLCTRPDRERVVLFPDEVKACPCDGSCERGMPCPEDPRARRAQECGGQCRGGCEGRCGAYRPMGELEESEIYAVPTWRISSCAHIQWGTYLTSEARCEWLRQAISKARGLDVVYGDTDSLFTELGRTRRIGKELGYWASEGGFKNMRVIAPKIYHFERSEKLTVKAKGLMIADDRKTAIQEITPTVPDKKGVLLTGKIGGGDKIVGFWRGAAAGKFFDTAPTSRRVRAGFGDRILEVGSDTTRAPHVSELLGWDAEEQ